MYTTQQLPISAGVKFVFNGFFIKNGEVDCVFEREIKEEKHIKAYKADKACKAYKAL